MDYKAGAQRDLARYLHLSPEANDAPAMREQLVGLTGGQAHVAQAAEFRVEQASLVAACLVGAIAEALVGPLSPPARAARDAGLPAADLATVSQALITFCLRAVGAPES